MKGADSGRLTCKPVGLAMDDGEWARVGRRERSSHARDGFDVYFLRRLFKVAVEALVFFLGLQLGFSPLCASLDCGFGFLFLLGLPWLGCGSFSVFLALTAALTAGFGCGWA